MAVVRVNKNTYTVDPLTQWDRGQQLQIFGLSLAQVPEVHFTNGAMQKAIVRQATMDAAGVIYTEVPDSLLQKPYTIQAFVCVYEGETFKTLYAVDIPVKGRPRPADYSIEDGEEIYSFNALENKVENVLIQAAAYTTAAQASAASAAQSAADAKDALSVSIQVGTVTTAEAGEAANVTNSGNDRHVVLDFVLPGVAPSLSGVLALSGSKWVDNAQAVTVDGLAAEANVVVAPAPESHEAYGAAGVYCSGQTAGALTFTCKKLPADDLTVNYVVVGG